MPTATTWQSTLTSSLTSTAAVTDWDVSNNVTASHPNLIYQEFVSALAKCFLVILAGYLAAILRLLNEREANGLEIFVRQFALPSLIFLTLASVELSSIDWGVIKCFAAAKAIVFITVLCVTISVSKPINLGKAGLYSIFCTQSNDLCLGLPIIESLYRNYHPEFSHYLYLLALVQYLMLTPYGFFLMELQRRRNQHGSLDKSFKNILCALLKCTFLNPIVVMTILGIIANVCWSNQVPVILDNFFDVLGVAFPAMALFSLGYSLVANSRNLIGLKLITPALLIITKILVMPLVNRLIMHLYLDVTQHSEKGIYENFAFLYGTIPPAPTVYIFATQFDMETDVVASGMVVSTFLSAPLMFLSGSMSTIADFSSSYLQVDLSKAVVYSSIFGTICSLWVLGVITRGKKTKSITHSFTVYLVMFQLLAALGGIFRTQFTTGTHLKFMICVQHFLSQVGILSSHVWTALLAFNISFLYSKSLCFCIYVQKYIKIFGFSVSFIIGVIIAVILRGNFSSKDKIQVEFLFSYGYTKLCFVVLSMCILTIISSFVTQNWYFFNRKVRLSHSGSENSVTDTSVMDSLLDSDTVVQQNLISNELSDIEELPFPSCLSSSDANSQTASSPFPTFCDGNSKCNSENKSVCNGMVKKYYLKIHEAWEQGMGQVFELYEDRHQVKKHVTLVILLFISMVISIVITFWKLLLLEKLDIYIELEFLNAFLCHGLGIISFAVFGLDRNLVINPFIWQLRQLRYGSKTVVLPNLQDLPLKTKQIRDIFLTYHVKNCVNDIVKDKRVGTKIYSKVFCGKDLVDWLLKIGLAHSRIEAQEYGNNLLLGRIIKHIRQVYYFEDLPHLYRFNSDITNQ